VLAEIKKQDASTLGLNDEQVAELKRRLATLEEWRERFAQRGA
jgi:hypothetical protein